MNRIIFVNRYYRPDHSATAQLLTDLAEHLATSRSVAIVTSRQLYDHPKSQLPARETLDGVDVIRLWTSNFGRKNLAGRAFDYFSFYISCFLYLIRHLSKRDLVVVKTDPPLISIVVALAARLRRARHINWLQDLFPEVAESIGVKGIPPWLYRFVSRMRNRSLQTASDNVVIGERMSTYLRSIDETGIRSTVIPNWLIQRDVRPIPPHENRLRRELGMQEKFIVGYSGNLGRAHDYLTLFHAAQALSNSPAIKFLFIGSGFGMQELKKMAQAHHLTNIHFMPYQPREQLAQSLTLPDVHLVTLTPSLEGFIVPSKIYGVLAAGRPVLYIGSSDGEIGSLLHRHQFGICVTPGDVEKLSSCIRELAQSNVTTQRMGCAAVTAHQSHFKSELAIERWSALIDSLVPTPIGKCHAPPAESLHG